jgi:PAS domain S-box-containing protein
VRAALGKEEIAPGIDYRGVPVLAATRVIPNSPWFLVAKIDLSELSAPLHRQFLLVSLLLVALIAASGAGMAYFWRNREVHFYRQQYETESQRRALAQRYEYLTRHANDTILIMDQDWKIIEANDRAVAAYGYPREELLGLHLWELYFEHHCSSGETGTLESVMEDGLIFETVHRRKDGATFPVAVSSSVLEIGSEKFYQQIIRDITLNKQRENALQESEQQLRYLSSQLLKIQEEERRRISKELHDELGQALMVMKFQIEAIEAGLAEGKREVTADFHSLLQDLQGVIEKVRRLSWGLGPASLEELGLSVAIENLREEFGEHIDIRWLPEEVKELNHWFSPLAEVNIYRILQESLTNIGRHAQASQITVSFKKQDGDVAFTVEDNGRGFEVDNVRGRESRGKGIGLAAMEERARLLGGSFKIWSQPGVGTKITFSIPLDQED